MDIDEDDDFYAPEQTSSAKPPEKSNDPPAEKPEDEELEEGEEDEAVEESDSVGATTASLLYLLIRQGYRYHHGTKGRLHRTPKVCLFSIPDLSNLPRPRYNEIRNIPQRSGSEVTRPKKEAKTEPAAPSVAAHKIDVDGQPIYEPAGKPITDVNIDEGEWV